MSESSDKMCIIPLDLLSSSPISPASLLVTIAIFTYAITRIIYDLYFHPLRNFPGPKIACVGRLLEFYYDVIRDGTYIWEIERMHEKHGPIIRINSHELHIKDSYFYSTIYPSSNSTRKVNKYLEQVDGLAIPLSSLSTISHDLHRLRRGILNPYFSKQAIRGIESLIWEKADRLSERLADIAITNKPVDLDAAYAACTMDIMHQYLYGTHSDCLGSPDFKFIVREGILGMIRSYNITRFFPGVLYVMKSFPVSMLRLFHKPAAALMASQNQIKADILSWQTEVRDCGIGPGERERYGKRNGAVMFEAMNDQSIPRAERSIERLLDEATTIIFAGTETTARALSVTTFYLLNDRTLLGKLREELGVLPKVEGFNYTITQLEGLPYLTGVVNEGIRMTHGPNIRLLRCAQEALQYKNFTIPVGTPVSQTTSFVNTDPLIFPDPHTFDPERWIRATEQGFNLERYLVSFNKGTRQCLGMNLAHSEIYIILAKIVLMFDMELFETTVKDVGVYHIRLTSFPKGSKGEVKVKLSLRTRESESESERVV